MLNVFGAYALWGLFPLYFPLLRPAAPVEILAHRFLWTFVLMAVLVALTGTWRELRAASARTWVTLFAASAFIAVNWGVYVYTINTGHVAEAALGYFINPLVSVVLGVIFLRERLNRPLAAAVGLAVVAVAVMTADLGRPPALGLALAFSFGFYGLLKKRVRLSSAASLTAESMIMTPLAAGYLLWLAGTGASTFTAHGPGHALLLLSAGVATGVPLLLFGRGTKQVPLITVGMLQYLTPMIQMLIAVFVRHEEISAGRWVGFGIIWVAVAISIADGLIRIRARRRTRAAAGRG